MEPAQHGPRAGADACWIGLCGEEQRDFLRWVDRLDLRGGPPREEAPQDSQHERQQAQLAALVDEQGFLAAPQRDANGDE